MSSIIRNPKSGIRNLLLVALALCLSGCTMFFCDGGGPLKREELGDWLGLAARPAPEPQKLAALVQELRQIKHAGFVGRYSLPGDASVLSLKFFFLFDIPFTPAPGLVVKGRRSPWLAFVPGGQRGRWLYFVPAKPAVKQFVALQEQWDALLVWFDRVEAYDVATRERVAARRSDELVGLGLGWTRVREVVPLDEDEQPGVHALARPKLDPAKLRYMVRDGNCLLLGLVGWGRVNHTRYLQLLWLPIPIGSAI
ncbi:MAG: hypothetical protein FJ291_33750 [Planctomycetes bacterium]|nr:hypothetical protein [Planctomycetota bacterium]